MDKTEVPRTHWIATKFVYFGKAVACLLLYFLYTYRICCCFKVVRLVL